MSYLSRLFVCRARALLGVGVSVVLYCFCCPPDLSEDERRELASHFRFKRYALPEVAGRPQRFVRAVHPSLRRHAAWISVVGAAVALNDLDGDGLPNDVCYVDTRTDQVIVAPVPGTPWRYEPFVLSPD